METNHTAGPEDFESLRPCLCEAYRIHLNPRRSYIVELAPNGDSSLAPRVVASVNCDGGRILAKCRGQAGFGEIVNQLGFTMNDADAARIKGFLDTAVKAGHVTWQPAVPFQAARQVTGSLEKYIPAHVSIEVTHQCNLKCRYCYHGDLERKVQAYDELELAALIAALNEWRGLGLLSVELTGGEPTLSKRFIPLLEYCLNAFSLTAVLTNGTNIRQEHLALLAAARNKVLVGISLDSCSPALFSTLTGAPVGFFEIVVRNIRDIARTGVETNVAMAVTPENVHDVLDTARFVRGLGVRGFSPAITAPVGFGFEDAWRWDRELHNLFYEQVSRIKQEFSGFLTNLKELMNPEPTESGETEVSCDSGKRVAVVAPDGKIRTCLMMPETWSAGSIRTQGVEEILLGEAWQQSAKLLFPPTGVCKDCLYASFCAGCAVTPLSVAQKEGRHCAWWEESGLAPWLERHAQTQLELPGERVKNFTERRPASHCSRFAKDCDIIDKAAGAEYGPQQAD